MKGRIIFFFFFFKYIYVFHCLWKTDGQFGHPAEHEFAFQLNWINYIDFPVGDYVTCNHN